MHVPQVTLRTTSPEHTRAVAAAVAPLLRPGDVVALSGELGAGKTCFVQGAASGLGVEARVTSPTFVLLKTYPGGRLPIVHCDVYRLELLQDVYDLGDEVLAPDVVTFVEWGDAVTALLPNDRLDVELTRASDPSTEPPDATPGDGDLDSDRLVTLRARGGWTQRLPALTVACDTVRGGSA